MHEYRLEPGLKVRKQTLVSQCFPALLAIAVCAAAYAQTGQSVVLDGRSSGRNFDGIGAVSAGASSRLLIDYPEPQRSEILDYLFKPGYGASLQHLKVEVGADVNSTDGSEPSHMRSKDDFDASRGYEWWLMMEAHKRNPKIVLEILPWGAPAWVGKDNSLYSSAMANYMVRFIQAAKKTYSLDIAYTGIWNEKAPDLSYVKELHRQLLAAHLPTKIVCCDEYQSAKRGQWSIAEEILNDPELASAIEVIGVHYPKVNGEITTTAAARRTGKPLWSSEDQPNSGSGPFLSRDWPIGGRILAHLYNQNYLEGALTSTEIWSPITSYYDLLPAPNSGLMYANTPWSGHYQVQGAIWATAHTTQFAQPGWQYLDSASGNLKAGGSYVSLRSSNHQDWSVVLETIGAKASQELSFRLTGGLSDAEVHIWQTNDSHTFDHVADLKPHDGTFAYHFEPDSLYSLTTTRGQGKGSASPPPESSFPLPYEDDFEAVPPGRAPKFLSDQNGAFESHPCSGRSGQCLEQVIETKPISWGPLPDPFTIAGDASWKDYSITSDVRFLSSAPAILLGRIDSADFFQDSSAHWPGSYVLRVTPEGKWELLSTKLKSAPRVLASGDVSFDRNAWHTLTLSFQGNRIQASFDGVTLKTVEDVSHSQGMFGLGTEWGHLQFDNLKVSAIGGKP